LFLKVEIQNQKRACGKERGEMMGDSLLELQTTLEKLLFAKVWIEASEDHYFIVEIGFADRIFRKIVRYEELIRFPVDIVANNIVEDAKAYILKYYIRPVINKTEKGGEE
jgi:hypothetical protein